MCAETACDSYYSCTSGLCQVSAESCKRAETGEESGACDPEAATNTCLAESYYVKSNKLYYCETAKVECTLQETPLGVFKDAATDGNYITCTRQEHVGRRRSVTPTYDYTCASAPVSVDSTQCTAAGVGGLYYVADANGTKTYYVCIAATGAGIPLGTASEYMVDVGSTALFSIQVIEKFVNLSIDAKGNASIAQYDSEGNAKSPERYKYTNSGGLIFARNAGTKTTTTTVGGVEIEGVCDASGPLSTIREYKRDFCSSHDEEDKLTDIVEYFVAVDRSIGSSP
ncbi:hypothetical protein H8356DRAFT_1278115 [Neocallimastix lanati (nom. inval.)]|nr:hypothetical protein H8356DRAFT_1278115 [Neocallimastix sp. JGI-2020a]